MKQIAQFDALCTWLGVAIDDTQIARLDRYVALLATEGIAAGGIGPNETDRIWTRHIIDSLTYLSVVEGSRWCDVGTGVGLPAIPVAIARPDVAVTALDRAGRRIDLLRRWSRIIDVPNLSIVTADVHHHQMRYDTMMFRASLPYDAARRIVARLADRVGVFGLTHGTAAAPVEIVAGDEIVEIPRDILDTGARLLRICP